MKSRLIFSHYISHQGYVKKNLRIDNLFNVKGLSMIAGDQNRTGVSSLGSWCSTTELHPPKCLLCKHIYRFISICQGENMAPASPERLALLFTESELSVEYCFPSAKVKQKAL